MIWGREEGRGAAKKPMADGGDKGNGFVSKN
jgi:hypothetical protein